MATSFTPLKVSGGAVKKKQRKSSLVARVKDLVTWAIGADEDESLA